jgi:glycosyltransferase involved in cell wall biosynthesis
MARVLIGIPTYNRPQFVMQAVRSAVAQTFTDWRAIVSDNASSGDTSAKIRGFVAELGDPRVTFHQQEKNLGEYGQGRHFLREAEAGGCDYMEILHDDDTMEPTFVEAAVTSLDARPDMAFFVCNSHVIVEDGSRSESLTRDFDERQHRTGMRDGAIDVLSTHMACGFTPISGAFFRMSALEASGFVDDDLYGCVPFENNIFLRLGERGAKAWFDARRLLSFRSHSQQMQKTDYLNNEEYVSLTIRLFERRHFTGANEWRRRRALGRLHRIVALHKARFGDYAAARAEIARALRANPFSVTTWLVATAGLFAPILVKNAARSWLDGDARTPIPHSTGQ